MKNTHKTVLIKCDYCPNSNKILELICLQSNGYVGNFCKSCLDEWSKNLNWKVKI